MWIVYQVLFSLKNNFWKMEVSNAAVLVSALKVKEYLVMILG